MWYVFGVVAGDDSHAPRFGVVLQLCIIPHDRPVPRIFHYIYNFQTPGVSIRRTVNTLQMCVFFIGFKRTLSSITFFFIWISSTLLGPGTMVYASSALTPLPIDGGYYVQVTDPSTTYTVHIPENSICDFLIVGGGGGGGGAIAGGGGAGGVVYAVDQPCSGEYSITVGAGGLGGYGDDSPGGNGDPSFLQQSATDVLLQGTSCGGPLCAARGLGGGGGGSYYTPLYTPGRNGGSGGGAGNLGNLLTDVVGGTSLQGDTYWNGTAYVQGGVDGLDQTHTLLYYGAGGGGLGGFVNPGPDEARLPGALGVQIPILDTVSYYAAGGAGGRFELFVPSPNPVQALGGSGIGGNGGTSPMSTNPRGGDNGVDGTGSGGGGGAYTTTYGGGDGGDGVVVIRFSPKPPPPCYIPICAKGFFSVKKTCGNS
jgi:hypothetical protein